jgi:hypothetical protein
MELRIVIFLGLISITLITNTLLIWLVYKAFSEITAKVTGTVSQLESSTEAREWIGRMQSASEQVLSATETAKVRIAELEPLLVNARQQHRDTMARVDSALQGVADELAASARKMRDVVAKPAFSVLAFAATISQYLQSLETEE